MKCLSCKFPNMCKIGKNLNGCKMYDESDLPLPVFDVNGEDNNDDNFNLE